VRAGASLVDQSTGLWAALGVLAALRERDRTGEGRLVDVSLYETTVALLPYHLTGYLATGETPGRYGTAYPAIVPYQVFPTSDGELMIAAANDRLFAMLSDAIDRPQLAADPRFATNPARVEHRDALIRALDQRLREEPTATWLERLTTAGVPAAPVQDVAQVAEHEQTRALGILQDLGPYATVALPLSVEGERLLHRSPAPALGEHTAEVLAEAGYSEDEIRRLVRSE
jgi:crotonobetainyl-CoA:carnitine CoA-transferase CaiB-like acyl-CoA transferase